MGTGFKSERPNPWRVNPIAILAIIVIIGVIIVIGLQLLGSGIQ
jgi:hypothetical protein